jgi:hypothetical protein
VYSAAALGVVYDYEKMEQLHFGGGETEFSSRK